MVTIKNIQFDCEYYIMNLAKKKKIYIYIYIYIMGTKCEQWVQTFKCSSDKKTSLRWPRA